jgi:nitronate monooxygenase
LAAVLLLGAQGAWIGTRFVATPEATSADWIKERVVAAGTDDTVLTRVYDLTTSAPFPPGIGDRVLRNELTDAWHGRSEDEIVAARADLNARIAAATAAADPSGAPARAGTAAGLIQELTPAGRIVHALVAEAERILRERPAALLQGTLTLST